MSGKMASIVKCPYCDEQLDELEDETWEDKKFGAITIFTCPFCHKFLALK